MDFFIFSLTILLLRFHFSKTLTNAQTDRETLISFQTQVQDPENVLSNWSSNSSHCSWLGVSCSDNGTEVKSLALSGLGLTGTIPPSLSNLSSLEFLDLSNNSFHGQIPFGLSQLQSLQILILSQNFINGSIPGALLRNLNLVAIFLDSNRLTGVIPKKISGLKKLRILELSDNNISGVIPSSLSRLSALTNLSIAQNQLHGEIPREIGNLRNLWSIQLSVNNLTGEIPDSLYDITSLVFLSLTQNNLTGTLRMDIGNSLPNLIELDLAGNHFFGNLPRSISNLTEIQFLDLSGNSFSGSIPLFGKMNSLVYLNLGQNYLSSDTRQNLRLFDSLTNCTKLENLQFFTNELSGELPDSVGNLSTNLQEFCVDENNLTGRFPRGVENFHSLISLALERNSFTGEIPRNIRSLTRLQKLSIQENRFTGEIPDIFGNFSQLSYLTMGYNQFSGKIPPSIGECKRLSTLDLTANRLHGLIPEGIFELSNLNHLVLAENSLTGSVPDEVKNLKQVLAIVLSDNHLSGNIPSSIRSCSSLRFLMMGHNSLFGSIPDSIGDLASLETLDLSFNNLSGVVPKDLTKLKDLKNLNLSFNQLEGEVPTEGVFTNVTAVSLQGNNLLCSSNPETSSKFGLTQCVTKKENNHNQLKFIISAVCLGICFVALICVLVVLRGRKNKVTVSSPQVKGLPQMISYNDIRIATADFSSENLIGKGGSGFVYKGLFKTNEQGGDMALAVKVLNLQHKKSTQNFKRECEALRNARHRNLVRVITSCSSIDQKGDEFKALVMEFMPNGSLDDWLYPNDLESSRSVLTLSQRLKILVDVASAIDYLHNDCEPPVVHCDLKPGNVLLDEDMVAHVGEFGLATFLRQNQSQESNTIGVKGSIGYIAPEYGLGGQASTSGDVYSFGILLLEMFIAKRPTDDMFKEGLSMNTFAIFGNAENVPEIVDSRLFGDLASSTPSTSTSYDSGSSGISSQESNWRIKCEECVASALKIGLACAAESSKDRLDMREALAKLTEIQKWFLGL